MTFYIVIGAVVVTVLFMLIALVIFALTMVASHKYLKKKRALKAQEQRSGAFGGFTSLTISLLTLFA